MSLLTVEEQYMVFAVLMAVVAIGFIIAVVRLPSSRRRYYLPIMVLPAVTAIALAMVSQNILVPTGPDGDPVPLPRMVAYGVLFPTIMIYIGLAGGVSRKEIATLVGLILMVVGGLVFSWLVPEPVGPLGVIVMLVSLVATAYLLLGPYARIAAEQSGTRNLLYGKLRNLVLLLWVMLVATGLAAPQTLGLLERLMSSFMGNYIDMLAVLGFGLIVLRSQEAMNEIFQEKGLLDESETASESEPLPDGPSTTD